MTNSQLQKANESDKTMINYSKALKKLDSPYGTECIMHNAKHGTSKKGSFNDEGHIDSKGNTINNTKKHLKFVWSPLFF
jgi:hypothetical protein